MIRLPSIAGLALVASLLACGKHADKPADKAAPPPAVAVPDGIAIPVELDGKPAAAIDSAALRAHAPAYTAADHTSWKLGPLLGDPYTRTDAVVDVTARGGVRALLTRPADHADGHEPLLVLRADRVLDVVLAHVDHDAAKGDQRLAAPTLVRLYVLGQDPALAAQHDAPPPAPPIDITIDGKPAPPWTAATFEDVTPFSLPGGQGAQDVHDAWSLREVAAGFRVESLTGEGGEVLRIDPKDWDDATRIPVIRLNRKGLYKFEWIGVATPLTNTPSLHAVSAIHLSKNKTP